MQCRLRLTSYGQLRSEFCHLGRFVVWNRVEPLFLAGCLNLDRPHTSQKHFQHVVFLRDDECITPRYKNRN